MTLTATELVELHTLEAIERLAKRATTGNIELEVSAALPRLGIAKQRVDAIVVSDVLRDLEGAGYLDHEWRQVVDEHWQPLRDLEWVWTLTASGTTRLEKLRLADSDGVGQ
jgi:hypothetical protein